MATTPKKAGDKTQKQLAADANDAVSADKGKTKSKSRFSIGGRSRRQGSSSSSRLSGLFSRSRSGSSSSSSLAESTDLATLKALLGQNLVSSTHVAADAASSSSSSSSSSTAGSSTVSESVGAYQQPAFAIFDIDSTLKDANGRWIRSEVTIPAIQALQSQGVVIGVATDKAFGDLDNRFFSDVGIPLSRELCAQGGVRKDWKAIADILERHPERSECDVSGATNSDIAPASSSQQPEKNIAEYSPTEKKIQRRVEEEQVVFSFISTYEDASYQFDFVVPYDGSVDEVNNPESDCYKRVMFELTQFVNSDSGKIFLILDLLLKLGIAIKPRESSPLKNFTSKHLRLVSGDQVSFFDDKGEYCVAARKYLGISAHVADSDDALEQARKSLQSLMVDEHSLALTSDAREVQSRLTGIRTTLFRSVLSKFPEAVLSRMPEEVAALTLAHQYLEARFRSFAKEAQQTSGSAASSSSSSGSEGIDYPEAQAFIAACQRLQAKIDVVVGRDDSPTRQLEDLRQQLVKNSGGAIGFGGKEVDAIAGYQERLEQLLKLHDLRAKINSQQDVRVKSIFNSIEVILASRLEAFSRADSTEAKDRARNGALNAAEGAQFFVEKLKYAACDRDSQEKLAGIKQILSDCHTTLSNPDILEVEVAALQVRLSDQGNLKLDMLFLLEVITLLLKELVVSKAKLEDPAEKYYISILRAVVNNLLKQDNLGLKKTIINLLDGKILYAEGYSYLRNLQQAVILSRLYSALRQCERWIDQEGASAPSAAMKKALTNFVGRIKTQLSLTSELKDPLACVKAFAGLRQQVRDLYKNEVGTPCTKKSSDLGKWHTVRRHLDENIARELHGTLATLNKDWKQFNEQAEASFVDVAAVVADLGVAPAPPVPPGLGLEGPGLFAGSAAAGASSSQWRKSTKAAAAATGGRASIIGRARSEAASSETDSSKTGSSGDDAGYDFASIDSSNESNGDEVSISPSLSSSSSL